MAYNDGHVFSVGEGSDLRLGGGGYIPPNSQKFRLRRAKKKGRRFLRKVFYYVEKISIPPASFGQRYGGPWGRGGIYLHNPPPLTPMSDPSLAVGLDKQWTEWPAVANR